MRRPLVLLALLIAACGRPADDGFVPLFNDQDLDGWVNVNGAPSTWTVRDGLIVCSGVPTGVLRTERMYENFVLELEWRHLHEGGNAGLFVHSDALTAPGQPFTRSTECQIMDGNHGDVFAIHGATMVPDRPHPEGWMRCLPSEERARPAGEWNHYRVESRDGRLTLAVNGAVVSGASQLVPRKGYICLESEGSEVHFRNLRIRELPSSNPPPEEVAAADEGFTSLYGGVDLAGWRQAPDAPPAWHADDWRLRGDGGGPPLWTDASYGDVELIADWRLTCAPEDTGAVRAGLLLRGRDDVRIPLACDAGAAGARRGNGPRGGWRRSVATLRGTDLTVTQDGQTVLETTLAPGTPERGPIGLDQGDAPVEFANLYVRPLD